MRPIKLFIVIAVAFLIPGIPPAMAAILRVGHGAGYDYQTITEGLAAAQAGDTVLVADGNYTAAKGERFPLRMKGKVKLARASSQQLPVIECDRYLPVIVATQIKQAEIEGFQLKGSYLSDVNNSFVLCSDSNVAFRECTVYALDSPRSSRCILINNGSVNFLSCDFFSERPTFSRQGIYIRRGNSVIQDCIFEGFWGGALVVDTGNAWIARSTFRGNSANWGAGIYAFKSRVVVDRCFFLWNKAGIQYFGHLKYPGGGSAIFASDANLTLFNSIFAYNTTFQGYSGSDESGTLNLRQRSNSSITNCTFITDEYEDNLYESLGAESIIKNCIFWQNSTRVHFFPSSDSVIKYCDIKGGYPGTGNISATPRFVGTSYDWRLRPESPCIDTGTNDGIPPADYLGNPRPNPETGHADMGAFEYYASPPAINIAGYWNTRLQAFHPGAVTLVGLCTGIDTVNLEYNADWLDSQEPVPLEDRLFFQFQIPDIYGPPGRLLLTVNGEWPYLNVSP